MLPAIGKPLLGHLIDRLKCVPSIDEIVLATTTNKQDEVLVDFASKYGIKSFCGSENDVMNRVIMAAESTNADIIVEITADCPLIDYDIIEQAIRLYQNNKCDYASNVIIRSYPDGMDVQVFSLDCLKKSAAMTNDPLDREHVTRHIRMHPELFKQIHLVAGPLDYAPELGITLDEPKDYELIKNIYEHFQGLSSTVTCRQIIDLVNNQFPELLKINQNVQRKGLS